MGKIFTMALKLSNAKSYKGTMYLKQNVKNLGFWMEGVGTTLLSSLQMTTGQEAWANAE